MDHSSDDHRLGPVAIDGTIQTNSHVLLLGFLVLGFTSLEYASIQGNCVTIDEIAHVPAGVSHWERGRFTLYQENPPLVRCLVSLPVWLSSPRTNYSREHVGVGQRTEWKVAQDFVRANGDRFWSFLARARFVSVFFGLACGVFIYVWTKELFDSTAALVSAGLWLMDPNVLAHSGLATLDVGATFIGFLATYVFWKHLTLPSWTGVGLAGLGLGAALASKYSMLALCPAWSAMMAAIWTGRPRDEGAPPPPLGRRWWGCCLQGLGVLLIGLVVLNCCYRFEGTFTRLGDYRFISAHLRDGSPGSNRFAQSYLGKFLVPLPAPYVQGFDSQKVDEEKKLVRIVAGRLERGGDLLGPLFTLSAKLPLGTLGLIGASIVLFLTRRRRASVEVVVLPAIVFLGLLSTQTGLNWAVRYTLPALPFVFAAVGAFAQAAWPSRMGRLFVLLCLAWNTYELVSIMPNCLSYGNAFVGGSARAHRYFLGSNYDWGQDLFRLKHWADEHPHAEPLVYGCYGAISPQTVGLPVIGLPMGPPGLGERFAPERGFQAYYLAVSTNLLHGLPSPVPRDGGGDALHAITCRRSWEELTPVARIGGSILIFRIDSPDYDVFIDPTEAMPMDGATP